MGSINDAVIYAIFILVSSGIANAVIAVRSRGRRVSYKASLKTKATALALTLLFVFQLSARRIMESESAQDSIVARAALSVLILSVAISVFFLLVRILEWLFRDGESRDLNGSYKIPCMALVLAETLVFISSTYPTIWTMGDVGVVYDDVINGTWNDWHCVGYEWFVKLCTLIYESQYSVICVQSVFWIILNCYIIDFLGDIRSRSAVVYTLILCCSVTLFLYMEGMLKDTVFSIGILSVVAASFSILYKHRANWKDMAVISSFPLLAILCRHGGLMPVLLTYIAMIIFFAVSRKYYEVLKISIVTISHLAIYFLVTVVLMESLNVTGNPAFVKYGTPMAIISSACAHDIEMDEDTVATLERAMPVEMWRDAYDRYSVNEVSRPYGRAGAYITHIDTLIVEEGYGRDLIRVNARLLASHPLFYIGALLDLDSMVWEMAKPSDVYLKTLSDVPQFGNVRLTPAFRVTNFVTRHIDHFAITNAILTRGGTALFVLVFALIVLLNKHKVLAISLIPIAIVDALLMISITSQDPRFILPSIMCAIFMGAVLFSGAFKVRPVTESGSARK